MKINPHELMLENIHALGQEHIDTTKEPNCCITLFGDATIKTQLRDAHELLEWKPNTFTAQDGWNKLLVILSRNIANDCFRKRAFNDFGTKIFNLFKESFDISFPNYDTKHYQQNAAWQLAQIEEKMKFYFPPSLKISQQLN